MVLFVDRSALFTAVKDECQRTSHVAFNTALARFCAIAELRMWYGSKGPLDCDPVRVREMETTDTITAASGTAPLPSGFLEAKALEWTGSPRTLPDYMPPAEFRAKRYTTGSGSPVAYTIEAGNILLSPQVSGDLEMVYYARPTDLSGDASENDVLHAYPMIYFHGVLIEAYDYLRNDYKKTQAMASYKSAVEAANGQFRQSQVSGNALAPVIPGWRV